MHKILGILKVQKKEKSTFNLMIKVVLLGAGNVGTHLFRTLFSAENTNLVQWYNRSHEALDEAKDKSLITTDLDAIKDADVYLISVSDSALPTISEALENKKGLIAHTAGSIPMNSLQRHSNHGVFYPLQTFSKQKSVDFQQIPLCLEANTSKNLNCLETLANAVGGPIYKIDSQQRKALHIAAVFVNNFVNHLYTIGAQLCKEHNVPFSVLKPLIAETAEKIHTLSPEEAQTGPAKRGDQIVIQDHINRLTKTPQRELYKLISTAIQHNG